jgi:hypothetical protein
LKIIGWAVCHWYIRRLLVRERNSFHVYRQVRRGLKKYRFLQGGSVADFPGTDTLCGDVGTFGTLLQIQRFKMSCNTDAVHLLYSIKLILTLPGRCFQGQRVFTLIRCMFKGLSDAHILLCQKPTLILNFKFL